MREGEDLAIRAQVSPLLMGRVDEITDLITAWRPRLQRVKVRAPVAAPEQGGSAIGLFFSGGVDSYYSLLKNMEEHPSGENAITHLIFAFGIDSIYGYDRRYLDRVSSMIRDAAHETGKRAIILETNMRREFARPDWTLHQGSALISTGLALAPLLGRCFVSASLPATALRPWGSHPLLDKLWSTEKLEIVHEGAEAYRQEKIASHIARSELALRTLRVCFESEQQPKNCGRCRKCLQTMIALHGAGALDRCSTFMTPLDVGRVRWMSAAERRHRTERLLDVLGDSPFDRRLARALRFVLWRDKIKEAVKRVLPNRGPTARSRPH
jgi:hypothetical protein